MSAAARSSFARPRFVSGFRGKRCLSYARAAQIGSNHSTNDRQYIAFLMHGNPAPFARRDTYANATSAHARKQLVTYSGVLPDRSVNGRADELSWRT